MMEKVLVTGAGGYIGSILVRKLLQKGYAVKAVDRFFFGEDKLPIHPNLTIINEDCRRLHEAYFVDVDAVIDLVAISNDPSGEAFKEVTLDVNHLARVNTAHLAKKWGVKRYILPSSCSIYGYQKKEGMVDENAATNPLSVYAHANEKAEKSILPLADNTFIAVVMRQATVYGYSPRMRFDLAINGMTYSAWEKGIIPLMREGSQWRPMVHVEDTTDVMCLLLEAEAGSVNGEIFNVGSGNYQLITLADEMAAALPVKVNIEWYGEPDHRSYRVDFEKLEKRLNWQAKYTAADGARQIYDKLEKGVLVKTEQTITLNWYQTLAEKYGGTLEMEKIGLISK